MVFDIGLFDGWSFLVAGVVLLLELSFGGRVGVASFAGAVFTRLLAEDFLFDIIDNAVFLDGLSAFCPV